MFRVSNYLPIKNLKISANLNNSCTRRWWSRGRRWGWIGWKRLGFWIFHLLIGDLEFRDVVL